MHFYATSYSELLKLPYYTFWEMTRNINRVKADEDIRLLTLLSNAFNDPAVYQASLVEEKGVVVEQEEEGADIEDVRDGLLELRAIMGGR